MEMENTVGLISNMNPSFNLKSMLKADQAIVGIWSIIPSPSIIEIFGVGGLDFVILDMEHGIYDPESLGNCIRAAEGVGCAPLVRVPGIDVSAVQWALDLGAHGVVVPQVSDFSEAIKAVEITKYPPLGSRGYNPFTRAGGYAPIPKNQSNKLNNDFGVSAVIIETEASLLELEKICSIDALDIIYIGVYDLSVCLGLAGDTLHPKIINIVEKSVNIIKKSGKAAGIMCRNQDEIEKALALGYTVIVCGVDTLLLHSAVTGVVEGFKESR
jgi:4-hydroxy-2-oxoheptanedioate aldolase